MPSLILLKMDLIHFSVLLQPTVFSGESKIDQTTYAEYDYLNRPHRQDLKQEDIRYMENGSLYIFTRKHFDKMGNRLGGKIGYVEWPEEYSLEIDTHLDFDILEKLFLSNSEK